jgi:hypothetical protein
MGTSTPVARRVSRAAAFRALVLPALLAGLILLIL